MIRRLFFGAALVLLAPHLKAQQASSPRLTFDVATIKPDNSGVPRDQVNRFTYSPNGRYTAANVTLVEIMVNGIYPTRRIQMRGGPDWIDSDRFDISAMAPAGGTITHAQWVAMVQALLEDRFKLKLHRETKEMPVFAMVTGKTPPNLKPSPDDEASAFSLGDRGSMTFVHSPIVALVNTLSNILHEPVIDATGITGFYDYTVEPIQSATTIDSSQPKVPESYADQVINAIREQLGFRLERRKAPLEITVIDYAEKPGEN